METNGSGYVNVSGGLITSQFISSMQGESVGFDFARPETFRKLDEDNSVTLKTEDYNFEVHEAFEFLKLRWDKYSQNLKYISYDEFLKYWAKPFFDQFGFNITRTTKQFYLTEKMKFNFSHRGWNPSAHLNPPVVHIIPYGHSFDQKIETNQPCPHDAVQAYLNMNEDNWALLFNGRFLRFIRDFHHTTVKGYVEFDIEAIFTNRLYSDFQILYRFLHVSRFTFAKSGKKEDDEKPDIYLEEYFKNSQKAGEKVGEDLRTNVVDAIVTLGNGFLTNELREDLKNNEQKCYVYYNEILRAIYRIIFLLYAEQRGLIGGRGGPGQDIYLENYSITALRKLAIEKEHDRYYQNDDHTDLWEGLLVTFGMIKDGVKDMSIYPYNGMLFDINETDYLATHKCKNSSFLKAIRSLTLIREGNISQIISYADLSVEEFGSVYESLLDYAPRITSTEEDIAGIKYPANSFILDPRGSDRKSTGSYYTNPQLVQQLIKSALEPVIEDRLSKVKSNDPLEKEKAILSIKVCDSASGSGAFLIAACNRLGKELAMIRAKDEIPAQDIEHNARRDVMLHCIYGVDVNPMAVELAKVSLWINAAVKDKPLNFLDHHIKCGNSLIGATPELMAKGIPSDAFEPVEGDDKKVASYFKKINNEQHKVRTLDSWQEERKDKSRICSAKFAALDNVDESNPDSVHLKKQKYSELLENEIFHQEKFLADLWTSAFFWKLDNQNAKVPTQSVFLAAMKDISSVDPDIRTTVEDLTGKHRFFHWHVEFPDVFGKDDPGFDCVLGNPPWEVISLIEKEFFVDKDQEITNIGKGADRKVLIKELKHKNPDIYKIYLSTLISVAKSKIFLQNSGRFTLTAKGKLNTYALFAEHNRNIMNSLSCAGIIVPTGIATDNSTSEFFSDIVNNKTLKSIFDFENRKKLFPIDSRFKFCLLTLNGRNVFPSIIDFVYYLHNIEDLNNPSRHFFLTTDEITMINPNTNNCPLFRTKNDSNILKSIYHRIPVLINESKKNKNSWNIYFKQGLFNMTSDSSLFFTRKQLENNGFIQNGSKFLKDNEIYLPLYEAKMFNQYDHRFGTFEFVKDKINTSLPTPIESEYQNPGYFTTPWYWANQKDIEKRNTFNHKWLIAFRDIVRSTDRRTSIFSIIPSYAVNHKAPLIFLNKVDSKKVLVFVANLNSLVLDYITRNKIGGTSLAFFIVKQLPVIPPECYTDDLITLISPKVVELTYTAWDLEPFAQDILTEIGPDKWNEWFPQNPLQEGRPHPFKWDTDRRFELQRELDAIYAHLYGISREDLEYILETFPIVKKNDEKEYGSFKTKESVLAYYDELNGKVKPVECKVV
jgi:hypothetical protein